MHNHPDTPVVDRRTQRGQLVFIALEYNLRGAGAKQCVRRRLVAFFDGSVQRATAFVVDDVDIGLVIDQ